MRLFKKRTEKPALKVLLDIRSSSVGAAVLLQYKDKEPLIKYTTRNRIYFEESQQTDKYVNRLMEELGKVLDDVVSVGLKRTGLTPNDNKVSEVFCLLASPWYKSKIKNFSIEKEQPIKFTKDFLKKILMKEEDTEQVLDNETVVDKKILSVYLNNYETRDPMGKKANKIDLTFYRSVMSKQTQDEIEEKIQNRINPKEIKYSTHPLVIITAIKNLFRSLSSFILIDVGGETTDLGLFKDSILHSLVTVPCGIHCFVRELSKSCGLDRNTSMSQLNLLYEDKLESKQCKKTKSALKTAEKDWLEKIQQSVEGEWNTEVIPPMVFITTDNPASRLFKTTLTSKGGYTNSLKMNREPILHMINNKTVEKLCDYDKEVKKDALLSITSYFSNLDGI